MADFDLASWYDVKPDELERVTHYVNKHPELSPILIEAVTKIREYFDICGNLGLELAIDYDDEAGGFNGLDIIINTRGDPIGSLTAMERMDNEWWLATMLRHPLQGSLHIMISLV